MALPTGTITMSQVNVELRKSATATITLNDTLVRRMAGKTTGTISMNDLRGKTYTVAVNTQVFSGAVTQDGSRINLGWNLFSCYVQVRNTGNFPVYVSFNGGSSTKVDSGNTQNITTPTGTGNFLVISLSTAGSGSATIQLIGEVIP